MENTNVTSIDYGKFHNEDVYTCMESIKGVVDNATDLSAVQVDVDRFNDAFTTYQVVLEPVRQRQFTSLLKTLDKNRDTSYSGMHAVVLGYKDSPIPEEKDAATLLNNVFVQYKGIQRLNNKTETGSLRNFFEELDGPYQPYVETLHLTAWLEALKQMNEDFDDLYNHRRTTNDAMVNSEEVTAARNALVSAFRNLASDIETMIRIGDNPENYQQVLAGINSILNDWKQTLNRRKGQKNANKNDSATPENNDGENGENNNQGEDNTPSADA